MIIYAIYNSRKVKFLYSSSFFGNNGANVCIFKNNKLHTKLCQCFITRSKAKSLPTKGMEMLVRAYHLVFQ